MKKKVYLDNLDAKRVVVRVASLVKGESQRLLPIDGDAVEVLVGQRQPHLRRDPIELRDFIFNLSGSICFGRPEEELMAPNGFLFSCSVLSGENSVMPGKWTRVPLQLCNSLKNVCIFPRDDPPRLSKWKLCLLFPQTIQAETPWVRWLCHENHYICRQVKAEHGNRPLLAGCSTVHNMLHVRRWRVGF